MKEYFWCEKNISSLFPFAYLTGIGTLLVSDLLIFSTTNMNLSLLDPFALAQEYPESQSVTLCMYTFACQVLY